MSCRFWVSSPTTVAPGGGREAADFVARVVGRPRPVRQGDADQNRLFTGNRELIPLGVECFTDVLPPVRCLDVLREPFGVNQVIRDRRVG